MKFFRSFVFIVVLIIVIALGGFFLYKNYFATRTAPVTKTLDIQGRIQDIGELATAEYAFTITQTAATPTKTLIGLPIPFTSSTVLYSYEGIIKAGIQFSAVDITQNTSQKKVYVRMPKAEILSTELDNDSFLVYDEHYSVFNMFKFADFNISVENAKDSAKAAATENGLLDRASENAELIIKSTIGAFVNLDEYEVVFY